MPGEPRSGDQPQGKQATSGETRCDGSGEGPPTPYPDWEAWLEGLRRRLREQLPVWPEPVPERLDLVDLDDSVDVPGDGDLLLYVHGYLGEGRLEGLHSSGAHQAAAFRAALAEEFVGSDRSPPTVVAGMWNSSTTWPKATVRATAAGRTLAGWLDRHADRYDRVTVVGHSLGGQVALIALSHLETAVVDSIGLLGAAVSPESVRVEYRDGIETGVRDCVYNYHSINDTVVCNLYSFREGHDGIGCMGALLPASSARTGTGLPENYVDVDVAETVHRHMDYFMPVEKTSAGNCVGEIVAKQLSQVPGRD